MPLPIRHEGSWLKPSEKVFIGLQIANLYVIGALDREGRFFIQQQKKLLDSCIELV
jgi:hypothetical protein